LEPVLCEDKEETDEQLFMAILLILMFISLPYSLLLVGVVEFLLDSSIGRSSRMDEFFRNGFTPPVVLSGLK
jgi:hypothetical protein